MADRDVLLLLDGHSLAYRAFYALPAENFSTTTGQATNAVYGFTSMLINALRDEKPTHLAVAFDVSRSTFRTEAYADYKATRSASPAEFKGQVELIKEVLDALGIVSLEREGYEADDVIATLATQAEDDGLEVRILTGDRDSFQLVDDAITVLYPRKGVSDLARMDPAAIEEKYGLTPVQYADYAALRGDPSDNLPGIPGVGEKTAAKWVREFGSIDQIVARVDEVPGKAGDALRAALPQVIVNRQLTALVRDVDLPVEVEGLRRAPIDRERVHETFDALQFRVLRDRLFESLGGSVDAPAAQEAVVVELDDVREGQWASWLGEHAAGEAGLAVSGQWGRGVGSVAAMAIAGRTGHVAACDPSALTPDDRRAIEAWLADGARGKVMHGAKGPMLAFAEAGWDLEGLVGDTELAAYLVLPGQRSFDLADLVVRFLSRELTAEPDGQGQLMFDEDDHNAIAAQAVAILELNDVLCRELEQRGGMGLLRDVEVPLERVLADMERTGIAVDRDRLSALSIEFGVEVKAAEADAHAQAGRPFNLGSPKQLQEILFVERGLPKTKKIKTGYTTDAEALSSLFARTSDPLLEAILRWRDWNRLKQVVDGLLPLADGDARIHTTYNQVVAATGRLSSTDPNLQNIPIRTDAGRRIRDCFVVGDGFECLLTADYSQIEMRIMAHLSDDDGLRAAFTSGEDLHTTVASTVFGVPPGDVDAEMRRRVKAMSYGLAYGLSAYGLSQQLSIEPDEARRLMDGYFERFGGVRDYLRSVVDDARACGYTETILGRRRYLPDLLSDNRQRREMAERMALNAPIQGSAADIIKVAMLRVVDRLQGEGLRSRLLLQVHDELVVEVAAGGFAAVRACVAECMAGAADLTVPLDVSVGFGTTWDAAGH